LAYLKEYLASLVEIKTNRVVAQLDKRQRRAVI
jgi:hypothetical protein